MKEYATDIAAIKNGNLDSVKAAELREQVAISALIMALSKGSFPSNKAAISVVRESKAYQHNHAYDERVRQRALEDPVSHDFPYSFDDIILRAQPIPKSNGYTMYQVEGHLGSRKGVYELGVTKDGVINHRFLGGTTNENYFDRGRDVIWDGNTRERDWVSDTVGTRPAYFHTGENREMA